MYILFSKKVMIYILKSEGICKGGFLSKNDIKIQKIKKQGQYDKNIDCNECSKH